MVPSEHKCWLQDQKHTGSGYDDRQEVELGDNNLFCRGRSRVSSQPVPIQQTKNLPRKMVQSGTASLLGRVHRRTFVSCLLIFERISIQWRATCFGCRHVAAIVIVAKTHTHVHGEIITRLSTLKWQQLQSGTSTWFQLVEKIFVAEWFFKNNKKTPKTQLRIASHLRVCVCVSGCINVFTPLAEAWE